MSPLILVSVAAVSAFGSAFVQAQSTTAAAAASTTVSAPGGTTTAAPQEGMSDWEKFGISTASFFGALLLWVIICYILAKVEDNRSAPHGAAAIPDTSSDKGGNYAAPSAASDTGANGYTSGSSNSSGEAGYLPVAIPEGPSGGQNRI
jgi:hypothetical protein